MTKRKNIPFSPPDISENEVQRVVEALKVAGLRPDQRQKNLKKDCGILRDKWESMSEFRYCVRRVHLRFLGIGEGDEVITSAYAYTASQVR